MKACPVCHAISFDDGDVCYGCMYRFGSEVAREHSGDEPAWEPDEGLRANEDVRGEDVRIILELPRCASQGPLSKEVMTCEDDLDKERSAPMCARSDERKLCLLSISILPGCEGDEKRSGTGEAGGDRPEVLNAGDAPTVSQSQAPEGIRS